MSAEREHRRCNDSGGACDGLVAPSIYESDLNGVALKFQPTTTSNASHKSYRARHREPYQNPLFCKQSHVVMLFRWRTWRRWGRPSVEEDAGRCKRNCHEGLAGRQLTGEAALQNTSKDEATYYRKALLHAATRPGHKSNKYATKG